MRKFEEGKQYKMKSICDSNCIWSYTVLSRTAKTITITDGDKTLKLRINQKTSEYREAESVYPLGQYSMCPILSA